MPNYTPALIVGAGPSGLTMAAELLRYGIPFRIIDKQIKPVLTSNAIAVQTRTLEILDAMGLLPTALKNGNVVRAFNIYSKDKKIASMHLDILESQYHFVLSLSQHQTETMLKEHLDQHHISIEMQVEFIDYAKQEQGCLATLRHPDGQLEEVKTDWLIACDGGHSAVRDQLHLEFRGKELQQHFVLADVVLHPNIAAHEAHAFSSAQGLLLMIYFDNKITRIIADVTHDAELNAAKSLTKEQINRLLIERCPFSLQVSDPIWTSGFWIHERLISTYYRDCVFFVGDAAHIHSPAGGQGMNTGIQDAYNLAWKLALVIQGRAKKEILNSYQDERYNVAKDVLKRTTLLTRMMTLRCHALIIARNFLISLLLKSAMIRKKLAMTLTQLTIHYKKSMLVKDCIKHSSGPAAGTRMIDAVLEGKWLSDSVRGGKFYLLLFTGDEKNYHLTALLDLKNRIKQQYPDMFNFVLITSREKNEPWNESILLDKNLCAHQRYKVTKPSLYLIRPDKYIGFRGEIKHQQELLNYLQKALFS